MFVKWHRDKVAFHRAEPVVSAFRPHEKDSAYGLGSRGVGEDDDLSLVCEETAKKKINEKRMRARCAPSSSVQTSRTSAEASRFERTNYWTNELSAERARTYIRATSGLSREMFLISGLRAREANSCEIMFYGRICVYFIELCINIALCSRVASR